MTLTAPSARRALPVRLTEIREQERMAAARRIARHEPADGAAVFFAALFPSERVYFVAASAVELLERIAA